MFALTIRDDMGAEGLRRRARRESAGRISARLICDRQRSGGNGLRHRGAAGRDGSPDLV
jgi:hypothetical protein